MKHPCPCFDGNEFLWRLELNAQSISQAQNTAIYCNDRDLRSWAEFIRDGVY